MRASSPALVKGAVGAGGAGVAAKGKERLDLSVDSGLQRVGTPPPSLQPPRSPTTTTTTPMQPRTSTSSSSGSAPSSPKMLASSGGASESGGGGGEEGSRPGCGDLEERLHAPAVRKEASTMGADDLFLVPNDDLTIARDTRPLRTLRPSVPEKEARSTELYITDALDAFTRKWTTVTHNYSEFDGKSKPTPLVHGDLPPEESTQEQGQGKVDVDTDLLINATPEARKKEAALRLQNRRQLFEVYSLARPEKLDPTDARTPVPAFPQKRGIEFMVDCKELSFALGKVEPFFCSLMLVDVQARQRVSETFHFDLNTDKLFKLTPHRLGEAETVDPETRTPKAVFRVGSLPPQPASIYLVLRIEQVARGDPDNAAEPYFKHATIKEKERAKFIKETEACCERLGKFTQPFAWSAIQVFDDKGNFALPRDVVLQNLTRIKDDHTDDKLYDLIKKREKETKMKPFPGFFKMETTLLSDKDVSSLPGRIDPSLIPVQPAGSDIIKEIAWFEQERQEPAPAVDYINHLYVYIESVNLNKWKGKGDCKNIGVRVQIRDYDSDPHAHGLPLIYGGSSRGKLVTQYDTSIRINDKKPAYYHEIKIQLPTQLGPQHHLFFTFFNVGVKPKSVVESVCAYAYLPLMGEDGRIVTDEQKRLPVASSLVPSYRSTGVEESIHWIDSGKPLFIVRTKLVSTLYTQDPHLHAFFKHYSSERNDEILEKVIQDLKNVAGREQVHFFPLIINQLTNIMCNMSPAAAREAFLTIPVIVNNVDVLTLVSGRRVLNPNLASYIEYMLDLPRTAKVPLHEVVCRQWIAAIKQQNARLPELGQFAWFLFDMIVKSMLLTLQKAGLLGHDGRRKEFFPEEYVGDLSTLMNLLMRGLRNKEAWCASVATELNVSMGLFLKDLLSVMDRGAVLSMVDEIVSKICPANDSAVLVKFKFNILKIVCDYEHYLPLNLPVSLGIVSVPAIPAQFWKAHFLAGLVIHEITACLPRDKLIRYEAISTLRWLLWKHDADKRYQDPAKKQRVAGIYFPYILLLLERVSILQGMSDEERRDWLICFMWIVKNCDHQKLLRQWWRKDIIKSLKSFFQIMGLAVQTLKEPHLKREVSFTCLDVVEEFMYDFQVELKDQNKEHMECMFKVIVLLLQSDACVSLLTSLFSTLRNYINTYPQTLFRWKNTIYSGDLSYEILRHSNVPNLTIRSKAAALFYLLIKTNFSETKTIARTRLQSTIAVSRLTGTVKEFHFLTASLGAVTNYAKRDVRNSQILTETEGLCKRLLEVIKHSLDMAEYAYDREMTNDLYYQVSLGYTDSPDLRVTWLDNLCSFHLEQRSFDEAVQCKMHIAALISEYLTRQNNGKEIEGIPATNAAFCPVSPNIIKESGLPNSASARDTGEEEGMYNPKVFSEAGLVRILTEATNIAKNANLFELVIDIYKYVIDIHQKERDYGQLGECFRELKTVCEALVKSNQERARLFSNYYRVAFFGKPWRDLQGKEYVYRANDTVRLNDFTTRLKAQFSKKFGDKVELLGNISIDLAKLKDDVCYFQVVSLSEYFEPSEVTTRPNLWDKKFNLNCFIFESPFTKSGQAHGDLADQCKRKTILRTAKAFPFVQSRLPVVDKKEIILEPIENAIEIVEGRVVALRTELDTTPPNTKTLQQVLQGSVLVTVNAGPLAIAKAFLGKPADYPAHHVARLQEVIVNFVKLCQFALMLNKTLIQPEQEEFQVQLEAGYETLKRELQAHLPTAKS